MIDPVSALKAKKAKILADAQREAEALDVEAREFERLLVLVEKHGFALIEKADAPGDEESDEIAVSPDAPAYKAAISVAENALKAARGPLELSQLFDACISSGVPLGGKRPVSTLSAYLSHPKSTVQSIRKGVYWLKGVDLPRPTTPNAVLIENGLGRS